MVNLDRAAVHAFWDSYDRRILYRIIVALEGVESWTLDGDASAEALLKQLGESLHALQRLQSDKHYPELIRILASTSAGRAVRILQAMDGEQPGTAGNLLNFAQEQVDNHTELADFAKLFIERNYVFERMQLLARIFAPARLAAVIRALESYNDTH